MTEAPPRPPVVSSPLLLPPDLDPRGRRRGAARRAGRRLCLLLAALLSGVVLVVSVGGYTVYRYFDGQLSRIRLSIGGDRPAAGPGGAVNFLIVGSDSRDGTGKEFQSEGVVDGERSDTTIIAHLAPDGTTTLVSFPRDTLVAIPGHGKGKLNSAITTGGPSLLIRTIEQLTRLRINHYVEVDLNGFRQITNAIGGVTVCVKALPDGSTSNLYDPWSQWHGAVGANHLDGEQALAFVRQRHGLPDGDFDRIRRQQQFISAVFQRATSSGVLSSPMRLQALLKAVLGSLTVDESTSMDDLQQLATRMHGLRADHLRFETIPVRPPTQAEGANALGELPVYGSVQIYDPATLDAFLSPLRDGAATQTGSGGTGSAAAMPAGPTSPRSEVRVDVYNATTVSGMAGRTASALATAGFATGTVLTWPDSAPSSSSEIRYAPGREADARALAAVVPGAQVAVDPQLRAGRVSLVLGSGFDGLAGVTATAAPPVSAAGAGASAAQAPAGQPPRTAADLSASCTY